jgi:hypothetical protein
MIHAQIECYDPIGNVILDNIVSFHPIDVDSDGNDDYQFSFGSGAGGYQFDLAPLGGEEIQTCGDLGTLIACSYLVDEFLFDEPFNNDIHIIAAYDSFMGEVGNFFPGITQYIVFRIGTQRGWIEILINAIDETRVDFSIGMHGIESLSGVEPLQVGNCSSILPIVLGDYQVSVGKEGVQISWEVLASQGVDHFLVERSDGMVDFKVLWNIYERQDHFPVTYRMLDREPRPGQNIYRLSILNLDGSVDRAPLKIITWDPPSENVTIYPNPLSHHQRLSIDLPQPGTVKILSDSGLILYQVKSSENTFQVSTENWPCGVYFVKYRDRHNKEDNSKLIITNSTR